MDISNLLFTLGTLALFGVTVYLANIVQLTGERKPLLNAMLYVIGIGTILFAFTTVQYALLDETTAAELAITQIAFAPALGYFVLAIIVMLFCFRLIQDERLRERLKRRVFAATTYDPTSPVHTTAIVLSLALLTIVLGQLVLSGGLAGLAESYEEGGISLGDTVFQQAIWVIMALLGTGLFLRRTPMLDVQRLALRWPTRGDVLWGVGIGAAIFGIGRLIVLVWIAFTSPEQLESQTAASSAIVAAFNTLPLAFVVSVLVAFGEEIFFRGALQPVFGVWLTSLYFALLHTQYTLTPASIAIFVVAFMLGWLRQRQSTTATIIAHFGYNFVQFALAIFASQFAERLAG